MPNVGRRLPLVVHLCLALGVIPVFIPFAEPPYPRRSKTVGADPATTIVYDAERRLPALLDDGARKYVWGLGLAYAVDTGGALSAFHGDGLLSVRALTEGTGALSDTFQRDAFGVRGAIQGQSTQPFDFTGELRDGETGFLYLRARMYDPAIGRFISRDPLAGLATRSQTLNRFSYVANNPVNRRDPSGRQTEPLIDPGSGGCSSCDVQQATDEVLSNPSTASGGSAVSADSLSTGPGGLITPTVVSAQPSVSSQSDGTTSLTTVAPVGGMVASQARQQQRYACAAAALGAVVLIETSTVVGVTGLVLMGGSALALPASWGLSAPVSGAGIAAGLMLEGIAITGYATAGYMLICTCGPVAGR